MQFQEDDQQVYLLGRTVKLRTVELRVHFLDDYLNLRRGLLQQQLKQSVKIEEQLYNEVDNLLQFQEKQELVESNWWLGQGKAQQYLVVLSRFKVPANFKQQLQQKLSQDGAVLSFIPNATYVILASEKLAKSLEQMDTILSVLDYRPQYKISSDLISIHKEYQQHTLINSSYWQMFDGVDEGFVILQVEIASAFDLMDMKQVDTQIAKVLGGTCGPAYMGMCRWIRLENSSTGTTRVPLQVMWELVISLSQLPFVHWLEALQRMQVLNFFANSIVQGGTVGLTTTHRPFWEAGLTGAGQTVGVGDTGLDYDSCFFRDPDVLQPGPDHRKVVAYRAIGDSVDGSGHGTHVCGTIAGSVAEGRAQNHNGLAPDARIAFTDLGTGQDKFLKLPEEGMERYYSWAYALGVRLHSDSWGGGPSGGYRYTSRDADRFMWDHPDFLAILAAGNEGEAYGEQATINSLAACKNAIAVGATLGPFGTLPEIKGTTVYFKIVQPEDVVEIIKSVKAEFGPSFDEAASGAYQITSANPVDGCVEAEETLKGDYEGKIVLVARGVCKYLDKVLAAQQAGAVGIIIYNTDEYRYGYSTMLIPQALKGENQIRIPAANIPLSTGQMLLRQLDKGPVTIQLHKTQSVSDQVAERFDNIALFSSFGPTDDDRIKPDLVAPGEAIRSAYGDGDPTSNNCQTAQLTGTSMATPIVAGAAILVRQYFVDGFYPSGFPNEEDSFNPSSALIKAVLINGAVNLQGVSEKGLPLEDAPSVRQGWGRLNLASSLPIANSSSFSIYVSDGVGLVQEEDFFLCVHIPATSQPDLPLSVTLAWTDPPADLQSIEQILVNDLDLKIISPPGLPKASRGSAPYPDRKNNVEQEIIHSAVPGSNYFVLVSAFSVPWPRNETNDQPFALVITGPIGMEVERCNQACTTCPSAPSSAIPYTHILPNLSAEEGAVNAQSFLNQTDYLQSALQFDDPCICSEDGIDIVTGADSMRRGCARHAAEFGVDKRYCYVIDSTGCDQGAIASRRVPGVAWRECNLFEEMYSLAAPWSNPEVEVGTEPKFVQNEDSEMANTTEGILQELEEFMDPFLNLTVIMEPSIPVTLVPMESLQAQSPEDFYQLPSTSQPFNRSEIVIQFEDLFNVTWEANPSDDEDNDYNSYNPAYIAASRSITTTDQRPPITLQDASSGLQQSQSAQDSLSQQQLQQLQQQQQQQQQSPSNQSELDDGEDDENELSGLAAIQAFQFNPKNFTSSSDQSMSIVVGDLDHINQSLYDPDIDSIEDSTLLQQNQELNTSTEMNDIQIERSRAFESSQGEPLYFTRQQNAQDNVASQQSQNTNEEQDGFDEGNDTTTSNQNYVYVPLIIFDGSQWSSDTNSSLRSQLQDSDDPQQISQQKVSDQQNNLSEEQTSDGIPRQDQVQYVLPSSINQQFELSTTQEEPSDELLQFDEQYQQLQRISSMQVTLTLDAESPIEEGQGQQIEENMSIPLWYSVWGVEDAQEAQDVHNVQKESNAGGNSSSQGAVAMQQNQISLLEGLVELAQNTHDQNG
eukprot:TRINITY_DN12102_c1_g1_i6.p1 TRINITY_DN12102_c1_g1~~TRINITY_DN12102_c1_g1_i6.p1  ORF type:complete len:1536 (+),score=207.86 TRINITY_DN12102_c1_g1_i6:163-4770(+)